LLEMANSFCKLLNWDTQTIKYSAYIFPLFMNTVTSEIFCSPLFLATHTHTHTHNVDWRKQFERGWKCHQTRSISIQIHPCQLIESKDWEKRDVTVFFIAFLHFSAQLSQSDDHSRHTRWLSNTTEFDFLQTGDL
jgi:hypothetical protein